MKFVIALIGTSLSTVAFAQDHTGHDMTAMPANETVPDEKPAPVEDPHAGHEMTTMLIEPEKEIGSIPAPAPPTDHAADIVYDPVEMAKSRALIRRENGGLPLSFVSLDLAELQVRQGKNGYRWEGEAWFGGDINRLALKYEGEGKFGGAVDDAEFQALYSRALDPYWNLQTGIRYDVKPNPSRTYLAVGVEGLAPYWFELAGTTFISSKGDVHFRAEGYYDQRITQSLILQPRFEANFSAQDVADIGVGSGLSEFELGLRLRYEIVREFAPYVGVEWAAKSGDTKRFARAAGEDPSVINFVFGIKAWF